MRMRYPSLSEFIAQNFGTGDKLDQSFEVIAGSIDQIFSEEESWEQIAKNSFNLSNS